jgi:hypothetical protein
MLPGHCAWIPCVARRLSSISCLLPLPNGALVTGGADRCVRYWEPSWPERSYIVAGPVWPDDTGIMDANTHKMQVRPGLGCERVWYIWDWPLRQACVCTQRAS